MSANKNIERICIIITVITLILSLLFCNGQAFGIQMTASAIGYENRIFDNSKVHKIDIVMNNWDKFIEGCESEEYSSCNISIDGELIKNVGFRAKGKTSLSSVKSMDSERYSFKVEFDQYDSTKSYHGLDKLCLNNIIQDNTYMKDYLAYTLMNDFGVDAPLCSYAYITVNGEDWGLYLAVEAIEDSFLKRNYGSNYGDLYKPDSLSFGGGEMPEFGKEMPDFGGEMPDFGNGEMPDFRNGEMPDFSGEMPDFGGKGGRGGGMGSDDVRLNYTDDSFDSYANIFGNAKTTVNDADKKRLISSLKSLKNCKDLDEILDMDEVMRYFVVHNFLVNGDSYTGQMVHNYYLYEKNGQMSMIPWDYNLAFGTFQGGNAQSSVNSAIDTPVSNGIDDRPMVAWIFSDEKYTEQYHKLFEEFITNTDMQSLISDTAEMIDKYVEKDPSKFCTYEEFQKGVEAISDFCELRAESIEGQLNGTIPSTSDEQKNSDALIDASSLNTSDMGTMGMGGGFGGGRDFGNRNKSDSRQNSDIEKNFSSSVTQLSVKNMSNFRFTGNDDAPERPDGKMPPDGFGGEMPEGFEPPQMPDNSDGEMPEGFEPPQMPDDSDGETPEEINAPQIQEDEKQSADSSDSDKENADDKTANKSKEKSDFPRRSMENFPDMNQNSDSVNYVTWILLGISAAFLVFGLIFADQFNEKINEFERHIERDTAKKKKL